MRWTKVISYYCCLLSLLLLLVCLCVQACCWKKRRRLCLRSSATTLLRSCSNVCLVVCGSTWSLIFATSQAHWSAVGAAHGLHVSSAVADILSGVSSYELTGDGVAESRSRGVATESPAKSSSRPMVVSLMPPTNICVIDMGIDWLFLICVWSDCFPFFVCAWSVLFPLGMV